MDNRSLLLDLFGEDAAAPEDMLMAGGYGNQGSFGSPVMLSTDVPQMPWQNQSAPTPVAPAGNIKQRIMEVLGASEPDNGGAVRDILSSRFDTGMGTSFGDYASGIVQSAQGKPTLGTDVGQSRAAGMLKQMAEIQAMDTASARADLYRKGGTGTNGATMQIINGLMAANPGMTFDQALYQYQTGNRSGTYLNPDKTITMVPGKADTLTNTSRATTIGGNQADIMTEAQANLPTVINNADIAIQTVKSALNHPGLEKNFGKMGVLPNVPGGDAADAATYLDQIKGQGFMASFDRLRGGGQISNVEGEKATNAYVRMQRAQSAESFKVAAKDFLIAVEKSVNVTKQKASGAVFNQGGNAPAASSGMPTSAPTATGKNGEKYILQDGQWVLQ